MILGSSCLAMQTLEFSFSNLGVTLSDTQTCSLVFPLKIRNHFQALQASSIFSQSQTDYLRGRTSRIPLIHQQRLNPASNLVSCDQTRLEILGCVTTPSKFVTVNWGRAPLQVCFLGSTWRRACAHRKVSEAYSRCSLWERHGSRNGRNGCLTRASTDPSGRGLHPAFPLYCPSCKGRGLYFPNELAM